MSADARRTLPVLAQRRAELIARCAQQRLDAAHEVRALLAPVSPAGLGRLFGSNLKVPLTIAGVVLAMIATRSGRAMPMITAGLTLWKLVKGVLPMLGRGRHAGVADD
jgi:hypothetical protein